MGGGLETAVPGVVTGICPEVAEVGDGTGNPEVEFELEEGGSIGSGGIFEAMRGFVSEVYSSRWFRMVLYLQDEGLIGRHPSGS